MLMDERGARGALTGLVVRERGDALTGSGDT